MRRTVAAARIAAASPPASNPADNPTGYRDGSPITHAGKLRGNLLLVHGTGDDNCHYQGTEALINELIAHDKQFTMFAYPGRSHSISERKNTTRHLPGLLTRFLPPSCVVRICRTKRSSHQRVKSKWQSHSSVLIC